MLLLIPLAIAAIACWWVIANAANPFPTPTDAAPASDEPAPMPARARTASPALRVHLCTRGCGWNVARAGDACYPVCCSPVHDAERILRGEA